MVAETDRANSRRVTTPSGREYLDVPEGVLRLPTPEGQNGSHTQGRCIQCIQNNETREDLNRVKCIPLMPVAVQMTANDRILIYYCLY